MTTDEWMLAHKGELIRRVGMVWECYDDCGCTEAQIIAYYRNKVVWNARVPVVEWSGTWRTDGEPGADAELAEKRRELRAEDPDLEASIEWQRGVDYGGT